MKGSLGGFGFSLNNFCKCGRKRMLSRGWDNPISTLIISMQEKIKPRIKPLFYFY